MEITVRHAEPDDHEAIHRILRGPRVTAGTLQLLLQSLEGVRKRFSETPEGLYHLVACADDEVVGHLGLETHPTRPRRRHVGYIGMAVRDDWQGRGVGTALVEAERLSLIASLAASTSSVGMPESGTGTAIHSERSRATVLERVFLTYFHGDQLCRSCADGAGVDY